MPKMFLKTIFIFMCVGVIILVNSSPTSSQEVNTYIVGLSEHPFIIDPLNEQVFSSKVNLDSDGDHRVFFDVFVKKFIILSELDSEVVVYSTDFLSDKLSEPIFKRRFANTLSSNRHSVWAQKSRILCMTSYQAKSDSESRKLMVTFLDFNNFPEHKLKTLDLTPYCSEDSEMWVVSNKLFIIGRKSKKYSTHGIASNVSIVIDLSSFKISVNDFSLKGFWVIGRFDSKNIALLRNDKIYNYDLNEIRYVTDRPNGLSTVWGIAPDNSGYYGQIGKSRIFYEVKILTFIPWVKSNKYNELLKWNMPGGRLLNSFHTERPLKLKKP